MHMIGSSLSLSYTCENVCVCVCARLLAFVLRALSIQR